MPVLGRALRKSLTVIASERPLLTLQGIGRGTAAGVSVGPSNAMTAAAVYAATSLISSSLSSLPLHFLTRGDESRTLIRPESVRALWDRPNEDQTRAAFYETVVLSLLMWGNFYGAVQRNKRGDVMAVWPIDPVRVGEIKRTDVGLSFTVLDFGEIVNRPGRPIDMLHIPWLTMPGRIRGTSPVEAHAELIGMSLSAQEHAARFLGDGAHMTGTIDVPGSLDPDKAKELWDNFQRAHAGPSKAGRVGVLTGGAKFSSITIPPTELQFLEQMQYSDRKIASIYRVPPHMVGDVDKSTSWGTGIEEQTKGFVVYTIVPIAQRIEQAIEGAFLSGTDVQARFEVNGLLRGSVRDRAEFYRVLHSLGALNANEMRVLENMPPIDDAHGERYYIPLNYAAADDPALDVEARFRKAAEAGGFGLPVAPVAPAVEGGGS